MTAELEQRVFKVTAPYVMLKVITPDGVSVRGFYLDAYVTGLTDQAQLDHHLQTTGPNGQPLLEEVKAKDAPDGVQGGPDVPVQPPQEGAGADTGGPSGKTSSGRRAAAGAKE
jgi:hypothetical protein